MYEVNGWIKFFEQDVYSEGCIPQTGSSHSGQERFKSDSIEGIIKKCQEFCGSDSPEDILRDSCEEVGRLDVQILEDDDSSRASAAQIAAWKEGKLRLWASTYTFHIERVYREKVSILTEAEQVKSQGRG